jgi:uncharacterized YkwD family protein
MKKLFSILIVWVLIFTACAPAQKKPTITPKASSIFRKGNVERIRIIANQAPLRTGHSAEYPIIRQLPKNNTYNVLRDAEDWYVVETDDGQVGAVEAKQATPQIDPPSMDGQQRSIAKLTPNEEEMLRLLNGERVKKGLNPLKVDMEITKVARLKSQDMIDNSYFSHNSPTYGSPFDMMKQYGVKYIYAGENLAGNPSIANAHESLMNSQGHRENILNSNFTHIGIGVKEGGQYGKMCTQMFVGR